ncbi:RagB/SusD family nutrient uptake outer membrane protein [Sediminibacterium sp.]|uniref:RagB/SusD family nutrient uptake outer membrane protein n=1 Tax=Sediminibacterium sp. TaxID=1917865 RepID=UPI0026001688|nr:RagB/SusD family nutrient uptake outer membrane protein [Sediminibacterium sp.]MBW0177564.1 RagB/SusD family nutrient uptake outer membrane protein [Sediminibacterium sp.]
MQKSIKISIYTGLAAVLLTTAGCKKDFNNPNAATSDQVFSSAKGLAGVVVGLQRTYASNVAYGMWDATGLITNETILMNPGNTSEFQFSTGGTAVDGTNALLGNVWTSANKIIFDANNVINAAAKLSDKSYASGLIGYATIYKALSMGCLSGYWEKVPDTVGTATTTFSDRAVGFARAVAAIDKALAAISANAVSTAFAADVPVGVDLVNTLYALKARYSLFAGNYAAALAAANAVDLTKRSTMNFEAANPNPVFNFVTSTNNVYQPVDSTLGLPVAIAPDLADKRIPFYTVINATINPRFRLNGFWNTATAAIPLYYPGEMTLIKAEAYARQATPDLVNGILELNKVVTKKAAADPLGLGADLAPVAPATVADLLTQIYRNRCIELYLSGMKLEDMRRFGRPTSERKRNLFPYPFRERDSNPNTPADPAF